MSTDHYAEAERLLSAVGNTSDAEDRRQCLMEAQVHVGLAGIDETRRMSTLMSGVDEALAEIKAADTRTIHWPPSGETDDAAIEAIMSALDVDDTEADTAYRAVLDAIGGADDA